MNRRALALVGAAVCSILVAAWWLSALEPPPVELVPPPPEVAVSPPSPPPAVPLILASATSLPPPVVTDAGTAVMAEVEIEVIDDGQRLVGVRVQLEGPGGRVSRPTDIMGFARFTLPEGAWRVTEPRRRVRPPKLDARTARDRAARRALDEEFSRALTTPLDIRAPRTSLRLELPRVERLSGRVLDEKGEPVAGAEVAGEFTTRDGTFSVETFGEAIMVQARSGPARSLPRVLKAPGPVELLLQRWTWLAVEVVGPGSAPAVIQVAQRKEAIAAGAEGEPLSVPVGLVEVLARRNVRGRIFTGRAAVKVEADKTNEAVVVLHPSPPLRGRLVTTTGALFGGLTVEARELDMSRGTPLPDGGVEWEVVSRLSTTTNHLGEFTLVPSLTRGSDPVYQLAPTGLWQATRNVLMRIDDAPVDIEVLPAP